MIELGIAIAVGAILLERGVNLIIVPLMHRRNGSGPVSSSSIDGKIDSKINDVKLDIVALGGKVDNIDLKIDGLGHRVTMLEK